MVINTKKVIAAPKEINIFLIAFFQPATCLRLKQARVNFHSSVRKAGLQILAMFKKKCVPESCGDFSGEEMEKILTEFLRLLPMSGLASPLSFPLYVTPPSIPEPDLALCGRGPEAG